MVDDRPPVRADLQPAPRPAHRREPGPSALKGDDFGIKMPVRRAVAVLVNERDARSLAAGVRGSWKPPSWYLPTGQGAEPVWAPRLLCPGLLRSAGPGEHQRNRALTSVAMPYPARPDVRGAGPESYRDLRNEYRCCSSRQRQELTARPVSE